MVMRISDLTNDQVEALEFTVNGVPQELRPFTFSPEKHYVVGSDLSRPRIFVVTEADLPPGMEELKPENLAITENGGDIEVRIRQSGGIFPLADAKVVVLEDEYQPSEGPLQIPSGPVTMPTLLMYYQLLYGDLGLRVLGYYQQAGHDIELGDIFGDLDVDSQAGVLTIQIEEDISPIQAAQYLQAGLEQALGHVTVEAVIIQHEDVETLKLAYKASVQEAARAAAGANIYLSGISIVNEGADIVMTVNDLSEGQYYSAIGLLPFISSTLVVGAFVILRRADGTELARFGQEAQQALNEAADITDVAARYAHIESSLTFAQRLELVTGGFLGFKRSSLAANMEIAGIPKPVYFKKPQAHHDLPQAFVDRFHAVGLDIDAPAYGRWVEGNPYGRHQSWSKAFNDEWEMFFSVNLNPTQADVLNKMDELRSDPRFPIGP